MAPTERVLELGGIATRGTILKACDRVDFERAVAAGDLVRVARGRYCLAEVHESTRVTAQVGGTLALVSAALHHGWAVKTVPRKPQVMLSRGRHVDARRLGVEVFRAELEATDVVDGVTSIEATLAHCMRRLPFDEALAIADSALRAGVPRSLLERIADQARGPGSPQIRRIARVASKLAANPFESALRAIALDVPDLAFQPQVTIREPGLTARPDLVDVELRIIAEADSFEWHGGRDALARDARRYTLLTVNGWLVLRFAYEHVMEDPAYVREALLAAVAHAQRMREVAAEAARAA